MKEHSSSTRGPLALPYESIIEHSGGNGAGFVLRILCMAGILAVGVGLFRNWEQIQAWAADAGDANHRLVTSISSGDTPSARRALDSGASAHAQSKSGMPVLLLAAESGNHALVRELIKRGADPNTRTSNGWTALAVVAATSSDASMIRTLLEAGADPNGGDSRIVPLAVAYQWGRHDVVNLLLKAGADPKRCAGIYAQI